MTTTKKAGVSAGLFVCAMGVRDYLVMSAVRVTRSGASH
jgi:hypothetical protein